MEIKQPPKPYHADQRMVFSCQYHIIFCPTYRRKVLNEPIAARIKELLLAKQAEYGYTVIAMEGMPDHVHLLLDADPRAGMRSMVATRRFLPRTAQRVSLAQATPADALNTEHVHLDRWSRHP
jgi:REP element-mobilizing transposase RayT